MPQLTLGDEEVTIVAWHKQPGDEVREGEPLLEIETDKASMDVESPVSGVVASHLCEPGAVVGVNSVIALVAEPGAAVDAETVAAAPAAPDVPREIADPRPLPTALATPSPAAQNALVKYGELRGVPWQRRQTEPQGTAGLAPVDRAPTAISREEPLSRRRRAIARRLSEAARIPQFETTRNLRLDRIVERVEQARAAGIAATVTDALVLALANAARTVPRANAWLVENTLRIFDSVDVAVAVDTPTGVVAPVIRNAERRAIADVARLRADLSRRARDDALAPSDLDGATITLSNIGALGADAVTPLVTPPQVAVLGVGRGRRVEGAIVATFTFVGDHRALDGADGARFLAALADQLESDASA